MEFNKLKEVFSRFGIPRTLIADNMPFNSMDFKQFSQEWNITIVTTSLYHPQSNGLVEKSVGIVKEMLKKCQETKQDLQLYLLNYRNSPISNIEVSPAQLLNSRHLRSKIPMREELVKPKLVEDSIYEKMMETQKAQKSYYDRKSLNQEENFTEGQEVWVQDVSNKTWDEGIILKKLQQPRSYLVSIKDKGLKRRNDRFIKKRCGLQTQGEDDRVHTFTLGTEPDSVTSDLPLDTTEASAETDVISDSDNVTTKTPDHFPYMVAILHINGTLLGTGAIVGRRWIVATAFQIGAFKSMQLAVRVGTDNWREGGQLLAVQRIFPHPMFRQFNNDVALLKTAEDIVSSPSAQPIPLVTTAPEIGAQAALLVWDSNSHIEESQADILPVSECQMFYPEFELTESNVCIVMDHILPYRVSLFGSPLVLNGSLVGHYMGMEANTFKPPLCSSLAPLSGWVRLMMTNETDTPLLFPLS